MRLGARLAAPFVCLVITACVADSRDPQFAPDAAAQPPDASAEPAINLGEAYRAVERLNELERQLRNRVVDGRFPALPASGSTPEAACCTNVGGLCPANPANWAGTAWEQLGFAIDVPHAHQYSVSGGNETDVFFIATGDLDCDGITATIVVQCSLPNGTIDCVLTLPQMVE